MVAPGVLGGEDHGRDVGKGPAIVVAEIVEMEDNRNPPGPGPAHQLGADRMASVSEQHVRLKAVEHLLGQVEEHGPFGADWATAPRT